MTGQWKPLSSQCGVSLSLWGSGEVTKPFLGSVCSKCSEAEWFWYELIQPFTLIWFQPTLIKLYGSFLSTLEIRYLSDYASWMVMDKSWYLYAYQVGVTQLLFALKLESNAV